MTNTASMIMGYWNMDFTRKRAGEFICVFFHVVQLGPIWRYLKLLVTGDEGDVMELSLLRLCHSVIQDAILFVIEFNIILDNTSDLEVMIILTVCLAMLSISFSYASISSQCNMNHKDAASESDDGSSHKKQVTSVEILQWITHGVWHFFSLQARMLSFSLFVRTTHLWAVLAPGLHLICHYAIIYVNLYLNPMKQSPKCKEILQNLLVGYTQMFDHIGKAYQICTSCVYFIVVSFENVVMTTTWFISTEKSPLNTGLFIYIALCHVIGTLIGTVVNQKNVGKLHVSRYSSSVSGEEKVQDASNQIDTISSHHKDTIETGIDFDTTIEYIGHSEKNQTKHESRLKPNKLPLKKGLLKESPWTLEAIDIMKHLISYKDVILQKDAAFSHELTIVTQLEPHITDHESSNSRNTNTVISSISSTIKDTFNGNESNIHQNDSTNNKRREHKTRPPIDGRVTSNRFERPLPDPPRQHGKSYQGNNNKFERKWRSFTNSPYENTRLKGKGKPSHLTGKYHTPVTEGINNNQTKPPFVRKPNKKTNDAAKNPAGVFPNVNYNTVIPNRKTKQKLQACNHLDWDLDFYTTESSTTDYASLPPSRHGEIYGTNGVYSGYYCNQRWRNTCSTCSSTDYFDLDSSEYGETWTWPPSKPGITKESVCGLPHEGISSTDNVTKWLCDIPDEQFA